MQTRDFCFWLQGFFEVQSMADGGRTPEVMGLSAAQVSMIRNHLNLVFQHDIKPPPHPLPAPFTSVSPTVGNPLNPSVATIC